MGRRGESREGRQTKQDDRFDELAAQERTCRKKKEKSSSAWKNKRAGKRCPWNERFCQFILREHKGCGLHMMGEN